MEQKMYVLKLETDWAYLRNVCSTIQYLDWVYAIETHLSPSTCDIQIVIEKVKGILRYPQEDDKLEIKTMTKEVDNN